MYHFQVYLCYVASKDLMGQTFPPNVEEIKSTFQQVKESSVLLENGREIDVDAVIFCTGYQFNFDFFKGVNLDLSENRVTPLYKEVSSQ